MTRTRASMDLTQSVKQWALDIRGDCARICPVPKERTHLPQRLQAIVEEWRRGDGASR